jgi:hypothetical protein
MSRTPLTGRGSRVTAWCWSAGLAATLLGPSGASWGGDHPACPSDGDCFEAHRGMGCDDAACCNATCDVDLFCCEVQWDSLCAEEAQEVCQPICDTKPCGTTGACSTDLNEDGNVDGADLGLLLAAWESAPGGCPDFNCDGSVNGADLGLLLADWDSIGSLFATCSATPEPELCGEDLNGGCNAPECVSASDCCTAHFGPGCNDKDCTTAVCGVDSFCCDNTWDASCASTACAICTGTCIPNPTPVTPIECGVTICGDAWALNGVRDTDWYEIDLSDREGNCIITATLTASFPATALFIFDDQCSPQTLGAGDGNCPSVATACVEPGVYRVVVAQSVFNAFPCESGQTAYRLDVSCACPADCEPIGCGQGAAGDCCTPHDTPFCNDADCCEQVCTIVPFCCEVEWDVNCVFWASQFCDGCQTPGACCLPDGTCVATSGFGECFAMGGDYMGAGSTCLTIECPVVCGEGLGDCCTDGGLTGPGCNDADCCSVVCVVDGFCCNFQWDASCAEQAEELCNICQQPGACCMKDGSCADASSAGDCEAMGGLFVGANTECATTDCTPICGPGAGDCFVPHPSPGCEDASCCFTVCAIDAYCCDQAWDSICTDEAASFCIQCGEPTVAGDCRGSDEGEPCGADVNGGCNMERPSFGAIACGETVCGTAWAEGDNRDTDWYDFTITGEGLQIVTATLVSDFSNANLLILDANCKPSVLAVGQGNCTAIVSACLAPGDYRLFISQGVFEGFPCEGGAVGYAVTLECTGEACSADGCGSAGAGDCCIAGKTPFCNDSECCEAVCRFDPPCCEVEWDQQCADEAGGVCGACS